MNIAIADASIGGKLQGHPVLQGLALSCLHRLDRESVGASLVGPKGNSSAMSTEQGMLLAQEAGATLALAGASDHLLKIFGSHKPRASIETRLTSLSLPCPALALGIPGQLEENMTLIDQRLSSLSHTTGCALEMFRKCFTVRVLILLRAVNAS